MSSLNLVKLVQDYLDADMLLERAHGQADHRDAQSQRLLQSRQRLENYVATVPREDAKDSLVRRTEAYLSAIDAFEAARVMGGDFSLASRRLYVADGDLQDALYVAIRGNAEQRRHSTRRILIAIKDEPASDRALYTAVHMAERAPAQLKLLHVVKELKIDAVTSPFGGLDVPQPWRSAANFLARKRAEVPRDIECETLVRQGDPAHEIVSAARRWGADFIVMGLHGSGRASPGLEADQVQAVLPRATCPVIVVGNNSPAAVRLDATADLEVNPKALVPA